MIDVFPENPLPDPLYPPMGTMSDGGGSGQTTPPPDPTKPPKPPQPVE